MGLYAVRVVAADSEADAIESAIDLVKSDEELKSAMVQTDEHLGEFTGEVEREVDHMPTESERKAGLIYFQEENAD